jgi:hypothetical protein
MSHRRLPKNVAPIATPRCKDDTDLDEQARESPLVGTTQVRSKQLVEHVLPIFPNTVLARQRLQLPLAQKRKVFVKTNNKSRFISRTGTASPIAFRTRIPVVFAIGLLLALLLLLRLLLGIVPVGLRLWMVYRACGIGTHLVDCADVNCPH